MITGVFLSLSEPPMSEHLKCQRNTAEKANYSPSSERHKPLCLIREGTFESAWLAVQPAVTLAGSRAYGLKTLPSLIQLGSYGPR